MKYKEKVDDFLNQKRIAFAGVSRTPKAKVGNAIYKKFKEVGYAVYPINPNAEIIEGDKCYKDLASVPQKIDAVLITTNPTAAYDVVKQCIANGVKRVWFHQGMGSGSYNKEAAQLGEENGLTVIHGGCPMMFIKDADPFHRFLGFLKKIFGKLEK